MKLKTFLVVLATLFAAAAFAQEAEPRQDHKVLRPLIEQFLRTQAAGLPGEVIVTVGAIDPRLKMAACPTPQVFLPRTSRAWGKTTVGVRCDAPSSWTVYVSATVRVQGDYVAAAAPLAQGQTITAADVGLVKGDLTTMPAGIVTDLAQAIGRTAGSSVALGTPLRQDALRSQQAIQQGQPVKVVTNGPGFSVSVEGRALSNAGEGQRTQARTASGQIISGIAKLGGIVEVAY